jgi:hypothetical protein
MRKGSRCRTVKSGNLNCQNDSRLAAPLVDREPLLTVGSRGTFSESMATFAFFFPPSYLLPLTTSRGHCWIWQMSRSIWISGYLVTCKLFNSFQCIVDPACLTAQAWPNQLNLTTQDSKTTLPGSRGSQLHLPVTSQAPVESLHRVS